MLTALLQLLGILPGVENTIDGITTAIANEKIAGINAKTQAEQIASAERVAVLQARRDVLVAEAPTPAGIWNARLRAAATIGPISLILKLSLWDKVIGSLVGCSGRTAPGTCGAFITDPIDPHIWYCVTAVVAFYLAADAYAKR